MRTCKGRDEESEEAAGRKYDTTHYKMVRKDDVYKKTYTRKDFFLGGSGGETMHTVFIYCSNVSIKCTLP